MMKRGFVIRLLESFLWAGSSALLISVAHSHPEFWFLSLFALVPFLWRVINTESVPHVVSRSGSESPPVAGRETRHLHYNAVILGMMLATCYALVAYPAELYATPGAFLLKLLALNAIFSLYGIAVNRLRKRLGFNAIFIAVLWLPLEYALSHYTGLENLFTLSPDKTGLPVLLRIGSLFGILMISFVIVLINSLILIILRHAAQVLLSSGTLLIKDDKRPYPPFKEIILERRWYYFPAPRAPPLSGRTT